MESELISVAEAAQEFRLSEAAVFKYLRQGKIKRWRRVGDRRTFVERQEMKKLLQPRVVKKKERK